MRTAFTPTRKPYRFCPGVYTKDFTKSSASKPPPAPTTTEVVKTPPPNDVVAVMNTWIREAHPAAKGNTGYVTLVNGGSDEVTLTGVQSSFFKSVEICEMAKVKGSTRRGTLTSVVIPAGERVELKPGKLHLLLKERQVKLPTGEMVDLTLTFRSGAQQTVSVRVINP